MRPPHAKSFTLLHASPVVGAKFQSFTLPLELDLPSCFAFRTGFVCPVAKTHTHEPTLLLCGHVLSAACTERLAKGARKTLKCPICPQQQTLSDTRRLQLAPEFFYRSHEEQLQEGPGRTMGVAGDGQAQRTGAEQGRVGNRGGGRTFM